MEASFQKRMEELETYYPIKIDYLPEPNRPDVNTLLSKSWELTRTMNALRELKPYYADIPSASFTRRTQRIQQREREHKEIPFIEEPELEAKHDNRGRGDKPSGELGWRGLLEQDALFIEPRVQLQDNGIGAIGEWFSNPRESLSNYHFPADMSGASVNLLY